MITSKPKTSTILSITIFSIPLLIMGIYGFSYLLENPEWYHYAMAVVGTPIGTGLLLRQLVSYKTITIGKKKIILNYLMKGKPTSYLLKDLDYWKENIVKTASGTYKETEIKLTEKIKLTISKQEYSNYDKVVNYLRKNYSKKSLKE
ncbi:MAG: hypothetical protein OEW67_06465 [Cyclobacteriaceae bacterium]|nr:hypothetical protein [Cyclobacteriaceae bacterium]